MTDNRRSLLFCLPGPEASRKKTQKAQNKDRKCFPAICALILSALILRGIAAPASAQEAKAPAMFPFVLPWDDASRGTATDVSFLNTMPAGAHGRIIARNGHFVEQNTGRRVRFLGVNFAASAAFPDHEDAEKVAARLAKLGVNIVRLHHMDNNWQRGLNIWNWDFPDRQHIDPGQLDKLDYLIAQLKRRGIYANINLHVSREFSEADGFPASVKQLGYAKRVDNFDRRMIQLQKNYARDLLTHVNPYTHLSYIEDPCVAVIEINNENSLVGDPWAELGAGLESLPEPFRGELAGLWNTWLTRKYSTNSALVAAWNRGRTPPGPPLLDQNARWTYEHQGAANASLTTLGANADSRAAPDARIEVTQVDGTDWHVQAHQTGLDFKNDTTYTVAFRAKADKPREMGVSAGLDQADWHNVGLAAAVKVGPDWQDFHLTFDARDTAVRHNRIAFVLGGQTGTVWIAGMQVRPGDDAVLVPPGHSLEAGNVDIPSAPSRAQKADWLEFLADTERAYADEMRSYLQKDLKAKANSIDSQISWGGLSGLYREAEMSFADNHAYWQHPTFPRTPWDPKDWFIENTSMTANLANGGGGTLADLAAYRVAGKPYSISEYNEPAPNDYQSETVPLLATFAAFQDWDILYLFDYGAYGALAANDSIQGYFGIGSNPAKTAFLPAAAILFRAMAFPSDPHPVTLTLPREQYVEGKKAGDAWAAASGGHTPDFLGHALSLAPPPSEHAGPVTAALSRAAKEIAPDDGPLRIVRSASGGQYIADSRRVGAVVGFVGGSTVRTRAGTYVFPHFGDDFAALTLTPMDRKPLSASHRLLLTLVGKVENQDMVWNGARTSVTDQWGHGPTLAAGIPAEITLPTGGPRHVYALDGVGKRTVEVKTTFHSGNLAFTVGPQFKTLWYEIAP